MTKEEQTNGNDQFQGSGFETLIVDCLRGFQFENRLEDNEQGLVLLRRNNEQISDHNYSSVDRHRFLR